MFVSVVNVSTASTGNQHLKHAFCPPRRSFHSFEQLSAELSLNSDSQKTDGRQNGDAVWTSAGTEKDQSGIHVLLI